MIIFCQFPKITWRRAQPFFCLWLEQPQKFGSQFRLDTSLLRHLSFQLPFDLAKSQHRCSPRYRWSSSICKSHQTRSTFLHCLFWVSKVHNLFFQLPPYLSQYFTFFLIKSNILFEDEKVCFSERWAKLPFIPFYLKTTDLCVMVNENQMDVFHYALFNMV